MDAENIRFLFNALREDIQQLREEVKTTFDRHEREIEESRDFRLKSIGAGILIVVLFEVTIKIAESIFNK